MSRNGHQCWPSRFPDDRARVTLRRKTLRDHERPGPPAAQAGHRVPPTCQELPRGYCTLLGRQFNDGVELSGSRVIEPGPHDELPARHGRYTEPPAPGPPGAIRCPADGAPAAPPIATFATESVVARKQGAGAGIRSR
jgi:hypothetical protein